MSEPPLPLEHFAPDLISYEAYNAMSEEEKEPYEKAVIVPAIGKVLGVFNTLNASNTSEQAIMENKLVKIHYSTILMTLAKYTKHLIATHAGWPNVVMSKVYEMKDAYKDIPAAIP